MDQLALDLRSDVEKELAARLRAYRDHMHRDWRDPGRYLHRHHEWVAVQQPQLGHYGSRERVKIRSRSYRIADRDGHWQTADGWRDAIRCLRCGEVILPYDLIIGHDRGWCGCPRDAERWGVGAFQYLDDPADRVRAMCDREDRAVFPDCAACGHAWGLHLGMSVGSGLPNGHSCGLFCACRGYIRPPDAVTPWGTCPGCWAASPDQCRCVQ